jgi:two-component system, NtrC family, sensor histidine kinase HydH
MKRRGLSLLVIVFFTVLTVVLTAVVIVAWEQLLRPPYYAWVARNYPGTENAENRYKIEQRGEHFFISMTVDVIVVSILLALVNRQHTKLAEAHHRLARSEKIAMLGRVAAQVAHEVRNPLSGLLLYSLHLRNKVSTSGSNGEVELVDKIIETVNHLNSTTEQILDFARPLKLSLLTVDLNQVVRDVIHLIDSQISANGVELQLQLSHSSLNGLLDEASFRAALLNLVLNAVQSMPDGGRLRVSSGQIGNVFWLKVEDTGSGMSDEQMSHLFEPFHTSKSRGLGLGMSYAQKVIEQHRGRILLESGLGKGTQIKIELPRRKEPKNDSPKSSPDS